MNGIHRREIVVTLERRECVICRRKFEVLLDSKTIYCSKFCSGFTDIMNRKQKTLTVRKKMGRPKKVVE